MVTYWSVGILRLRVVDRVVVIFSAGFSLSIARILSTCIGILLSVTSFISCGNEPVTHEKDNPFVIGRIEKVGDNLWRYERQNWNVNLFNFLSAGRQSITTDYELSYKVGDTLRLYCE